MKEVLTQFPEHIIHQIKKSCCIDYLLPNTKKNGGMNRRVKIFNKIPLATKNMPFGSFNTKKKSRFAEWLIHRDND